MPIKMDPMTFIKAYIAEMQRLLPLEVIDKMTDQMMAEGKISLPNKKEMLGQLNASIFKYEDMFRKLRVTHPDYEKTKEIYFKIRSQISEVSTFVE